MEHKKIHPGSHLNLERSYQCLCKNIAHILLLLLLLLIYAANIELHQYEIFTPSRWKFDILFSPYFLGFGRHIEL